MSVPSYHVHFKELTGSSPMQYVKAMRLLAMHRKTDRRVGYGESGLRCRNMHREIDQIIHGSGPLKVDLGDDVMRANDRLRDMRFPRPLRPGSSLAHRSLSQTARQPLRPHPAS